MSLDLPPSICSRADVRGLTQEIRSYARWYSGNSIKKRLKAGKSEVQPALSPSASELLRDWTMKKPLSTANLDELITALDNFSTNAGEITLTLAAPPPTGLKKTLVSWCRQNISSDTLVNFEFDSTILGGLILRYKSRVFDWSWREQIMANHAKFAEVLSSV